MSRLALQRDAIKRILHLVSEEPSLEVVQNAVVEEACRLTDAARAVFCTLAAEGEMLDYAAAYGENAAQIVGLRVRVADSLSENTLKTERPTLFQNRKTAVTGSLFPQEAEEKTVPSIIQFPPYSEPEPALFSAVVVPVMQKGRIFGTLSALNQGSGSGAPGAFDAEDIETMQMLAETISLAYSMQQTSKNSREQARELQALYRAMRVASGSLNVQEVLDRTIDTLCTHLEHQAAALFLLNDERTHLFLAASRGLTHAEQEIQLAVDNGPAAQTLETGQPRIIGDTTQEPDFQHITDIPAQSALLSPVLGRSEAIGLLVMVSARRDAYQPEDLKLLAAVGMRAGVPIENAWLYEGAQRRAEEAASLYDLSQRIGSTLQPERILEYVSASVHTLLQVDRVAILLHEPRQNRLLLHKSLNMPPEAEENYRPCVGEGIAGWVYEWQTPQAVADVEADARNRSAPLEPYAVASALTVPMQMGEEPIGTLQALSERRRLFTVAEMELLYTIANQAAVAVMNARAFQETRARSQETRRYFRRIAHALGVALEDSKRPENTALLIREMMRADRLAIYLLKDDALRLHMTDGFRTTQPPDETVQAGRGLCGWVARRGQALALENLEADPRSASHAWLQKDKMASYLAVPLKQNRKTMGVLEIYTQNQHPFSREEAQLLATFTRRVQLADMLAGHNTPETVN